MPKLILAALLAACPGFVLADYMAGDQHAWVRLTQLPCSDARVVGHLKEAGAEADAFRAAFAHTAARDHAACWHPVEGGVVLLYDTGRAGVIRLEDLREAPQA